MTATTFFTTLGVVTGALIGLAVLLNPLRKKIKELVKWANDFMRDWSGEEAGPGRDCVPGIMERLNKLDGELSQNGGNSTKDVVNRLSDKIDLLMEAFVEMGQRLISIETHLKIDTEVTDHNDDI